MSFRDASGLVATVLGKLDWLSSVGANAVRAVAIVDGVAAVAFYAVVGRTWGLLGVVIAAVAAIPAALLWWFARALDAAVDRTKIELSVNDLLSKTGDSVGEVLSARRQRFGLIRAGWRAVARVRELRADIERLGLDLSAWATVSNPGSLFVAGLSVLASGAVVVTAGLAIVLKLAF